jgi:hypothetical protein
VGGMGIAVVLLALAGVALGVVGLLLCFVVVMWFIRRRRAASMAIEETVINAPRASAEAPSRSQSQRAPAMPAPPPKSMTPPPAIAPPGMDVTPAPAPVSRSSGAQRAAQPAPTPAGRTSIAPKSGTPAPAGFAPPPPPPPFKPLAPPSGPPPKGPLIGFFDEDKDDAKTELFSRDAAARYAAMLDDDDDGDHTELFSNHDLDADVAAMLAEEEESTGKAGKAKKKPPGRVVAED